MTATHTKARKRQWADIPKEERSRIMSERVKKGWANLSAKEKTLRAKRLNEIRWGKNKKKK